MEMEMEAAGGIVTDAVRGLAREQLCAGHAHESWVLGRGLALGGGLVNGCA